jgi:putative hemolysin
MDVLELFKQHRTELALVVDEYGEIQGLVTLADVMSVLVGQVSVSGAQQEPDAVQRDDGSWLLDGAMPLDRFRELFDTGERFPSEDSGAYHTLAGFMLCQLGYIPGPSDHVAWAGRRFEVVDMDGNRIDRLLVSQLPGPGAAETR